MHFIDQITNYIIRPSRQRYHINRLGLKQIFLTLPSTSNFPTYQTAFANSPHIMRNNNPNQNFLSVFRDDYTILNPSTHLHISYSYYTSHMTPYPDLVIIYLHANNGSRVQGLHYLNALLQNRFNVCLLDFAGSGSSEGQYVTLGCDESEDLSAIISHMELIKGAKRFLFWGRSMGAVTALMYSSKLIKQKKQSPTKIVGCILDSPFQDLRRLVKQTASDKTGLPQIFFQPILGFVNNKLNERIGHEFQQYNMSKYVKQISSIKSKHIIPVLFITSCEDKLVKSHHVQQLFQQYPGQVNLDKFLLEVTHQHHQDRDAYTINKCIQFIDSIVKNGSRVKISSLNKNQPQIYSPDKYSLENPKFSFKNQQVIKLDNSIVNQKDSPFCQFTSPKNLQASQARNNKDRAFDFRSTNNLKGVQKKKNNLSEQHLKKNTNSINAGSKQKYDKKSPRYSQISAPLQFNAKNYQSQFSTNSNKHDVKQQRQRIKLSKYNNRSPPSINSGKVKINMNQSYQQSDKNKNSSQYFEIPFFDINKDQNSRLNNKMILSFSQRRADQIRNMANYDNKSLSQGENSGIKNNRSVTNQNIPEGYQTQNTAYNKNTSVITHGQKAINYDQKAINRNMSANIYLENININIPRQQQNNPPSYQHNNINMHNNQKINIVSGGFQHMNTNKIYQSPPVYMNPSIHNNIAVNPLNYQNGNPHLQAGPHFIPLSNNVGHPSFHAAYQPNMQIKPVIQQQAYPTNGYVQLGHTAQNKNIEGRPTNGNLIKATQNTRSLNKMPTITQLNNNSLNQKYPKYNPQKPTNKISLSKTNRSIYNL